MKRTLLRALATLAVLAGASPVAAQGIDLLTGWAGETELCSLTPAATVELFGIPSRALSDGVIIEYSHRGILFRFDGEEANASLASVTVYPVDADGFMGYRGHFLGTVASGTTREPVQRILRSVRAEIVNDEPDAIHARQDGFELRIAFVDGVIDIVEFACTSGDEPVR